MVNVSSSSGLLLRILGEKLRKQFAKSDSILTIKELDGMIQDFIDSAEIGNHKDETEFKILVTLLCHRVSKITPPRILCLDMCLCFFLRASMMV